MTNREKFNQCLLNYVQNITAMKDEELVKLMLKPSDRTWFIRYLEDFAHIYGYIPTFNNENFAQWLTQECIEDAES